MALHSSTLAWKIPWTEEPGRVHGVEKSRTQLSDAQHSAAQKSASQSSSVSASPAALSCRVWISGPGVGLRFYISNTLPGHAGVWLVSGWNFELYVQNSHVSLLPLHS